MEVRYVSLHEQEITAVEGLTLFTDIRMLNLHGIEVSDLSPLAGMRRMRSLRLHDTPVSDLSPLAKIQKVWIHVSENQLVKIPPELESQVARHSGSRIG